MGRIIIVLPIYLACMFLAPSLPGYAAFHAAVVENGIRVWHLWAYGAGLGVGLLGAVIIEFWVKPYRFGGDSLWRILRMGLIGVVVTCAYQLVAFYTTRELSVLILIMPLVFMIAETAFEICDYVLHVLRRGGSRRSAYRMDEASRY